MADLSTKERADAILAIKHTCCRPHPDMPGYRIVGWVVPDNVAGLSCGLFALEEIARRAAERDHWLQFVSTADRVQFPFNPQQ